MKKSRLVALILGLVLLVPLFSGCAQTTTPPPSGGDAPEAETTKAPEESQETQTEQPSGEKVKVKLYMLPQDDDSDIVKQRFEFIKGKVEAKFPDYDIEWTRMAPGTDYRQQYDKLLMSGDGPTLWGSLPFVDIQTRMRNGTIADITDYVVNWDLRNEGKVNPSIEDALHNDEGHWFAVPYEPYIMGMLYNKTAIEAGGGSTDNVPKTWEEFGTLAQGLTDKNAPRFGYTLLGSDYCAWPLTPWVWSAGGEMVIPNDDGTYSIGFNQEKGVDAIMYMHDLVFKYQCTQTDLLESYSDYMSNMTVGYACYGWGLPTSLDAEKLAAYDEKQENFGVIPIPGQTEADVVAFAGGETWTMHPQATKDQMDACWNILNLLSYDEEFLREKWQLENELGLLDPKPAARQDLVEAKYSYATNWPDHWKTEFAALNAVARPEPFCAEWNSLKDYIVAPFQQILANPNITREEAQALLDECAEKLYTDFPDAYRKP